MTSISDQELSKKFVTKSTREEAFQEIVQLYKERLYWHIRRIVYSHDDTDDLLQNTFVKVWEKADSFSQKSSLFTWVYRIATNEALQSLRKKKRLFMSIDDVSEQLYTSHSADFSLSADEIEHSLYKAIATLPNQQKLVFQMRYFDELKYEEISKVLNVSVGSLKASYHLAVKKIEKSLQTI